MWASTDDMVVSVDSNDRMTSRSGLRAMSVIVGALTFAFLAPGATAELRTFTGGPVTINDSLAPATTASPYPATITASGVQIVNNLHVRLSSFAHPFPDDVDVLLVGPGGQRVLLVSDAGASASANATLIFHDQWGPVSDPIATGAYRPTNVDDGSLDIFPAPAPPGPFGSALSVFRGLDANGTWSLYVVDDDAEGAGTIASWQLEIFDRPPAFVGIESPTIGMQEVSEGAGAVRVSVRRLLESGSFAARVGYTTEPVTSGSPAVPGRDYMPVTGTLDFAPGETIKSFDVPILDDRLREPENEFFAVRLTEFSGDAALAFEPFPSVRKLAIVDNEPDPTTPRVSGRAVQRVLRQRGVILTVRFNLDGTVRTAGTIALPRAAAARSVRLKPVKRSVTAGVPVKLKLRLSRRALQSVRSALKQKRRLTASVKVVATDLARTTEGEIAKRRVKLKR